MTQFKYIFGSEEIKVAVLNAKSKPSSKSTAQAAIQPVLN
jgi:hypothetical protein